MALALEDNGDAFHGSRFICSSRRTTESFNITMQEQNIIDSTRTQRAFLARPAFPAFCNTVPFFSGCQQDSAEAQALETRPWPSLWPPVAGCSLVQGGHNGTPSGLPNLAVSRDQALAHHEVQDL